MTAPAPAPVNAGMPVSLFASTMGLASLGLAWREEALTMGFGPGIGETLLAIAALAFVVLGVRYVRKAIRAPESIRAEFANPIASNYFGTITISLSLFAAGLVPYTRELASVIWAIAAIGSVTLVLLVLSHWITTPRELTHMTPALFIPVVGNAVAVYAASALGFEEFGWILFAIALVTWMTAQPLVFYRLLFNEPMAPQMTPALAVLVSSPAVLASALYFLNGHQADAGFRILAFFALFLAALVLLVTRLSFRVPFSAAWWGYTFPAAALAAALVRYSAALHSVLSIGLAWTGLSLASAVVLFVALRSVPSWGPALRG